MIFWRKSKNQKEQEREAEEQRLLHRSSDPEIEPSTDAQDSDLDEDTRHNLEPSDQDIIEEADVTPTPRHVPSDDMKEVEDLSDHTEEGGWLSRLTKGLSKSSNKLGQGISDIFTKKKLDEEALEELEELLITADMGPKTAAKIVEAVKVERFDKEISADEIKEVVAQKIEEILLPVTKPLVFEHDGSGPYVLVVAGVNGVGKTTTIGKVAHWLKTGAKKSVMLAAGDTFRAAAVEQLQEWGKRSSVPVVAKEIGDDAAAVAYEAYQQAEEQGMDVLMVDTAGRLHNKKNLMEELAKIVRVLKKKSEAAPHGVVLVLDATTGQNAHAQLETFKEMVNVTGLIVTKLDGSAKGGVLVSLADQFGLPVHLIGVGEQAEDLNPFSARSFARSLLGLES